jgi:hypothetical protein
MAETIARHRENKNDELLQRPPLLVILQLPL